MVLRLSSVLYRTTGNMTKKLRMQTCEEIGKALIDGAKKGHSVNIEETMKLLQQKMRAKDMKKVIPSGSKEEAVKFMIDENILSEKLAKQQADQFVAATITVPGGKKAMLFIPDMSAEMQTEVSASYVAHEVQHLLRELASFKGKAGNFIAKIKGKKALQKMQETYGEIIQKNYMSLYIEKIIKEPHSSIDEMWKYIQEHFIKMKGTRKNILQLSSIKRLMQDEAYSYGVQGRVFAYGRTGNPNAGTSFGIYSNGFKTGANAVKKERNSIIKNRIRRFFGIKEKDYTVKTEETMNIKDIINSSKEKKVFNDN